ncbi:hypothetical protein GCM10027563_02860 [Parasphingorhabdus pacifica]
MDRGERPHVEDKLDLYAAGVLDGVDWLTVRTHLTDCESCQDELGRLPVGKALPRRIPPTARHHDGPPGWPVVVGTSFVAALVAFSVGYALQSGL